MTDSLQLPLFEKKSNWTPPEFFPDLSGAKQIGVDIETKDPNLKQRGCGAHRNDGFIAGVSLHADGVFTGYFPIRHLAGGNLDPSTVFRYLSDTLANPAQEKIFTKAIYDLEWLKYSGVEVKGPIRDIALAEALIDEERKTYSLDSLAKQYLNRGKDEEGLREAAINYFDDPKDIKKNMWKYHPSYVGAYAEADARDPVEIYAKQRKILEEQGLLPVFELESELVPLLLEMKFRGVRVDEERAEGLKGVWTNQYYCLLSDLKIFSKKLDIWSNDSIAKFCDYNKIHYDYTEKGNPTFTKDFLKAHAHPALNLIQKTRELHTLLGFVKIITEHTYKGRIHADFNQMRSDDYGTRTGRFSSSNPNLQQIPSRNEELAPLIRGLFLPEEGQKWAKIDYSQQEPRILVHYACLLNKPGAKEAKESYLNGVDFYDFVKNTAGISRSDAKTLTLARFYEMGRELLAEKLGCSEEEASNILDKFDKHAPFVKMLSYVCRAEAEARGYIRTILKRRRHFKKIGGKWMGTYKALNALIQGSGADMAKKAMLDGWRSGFLPLMMVHDEINYSVDNREQAVKLKIIMESAIPGLHVPMVADLNIGETWK